VLLVDQDMGSFGPLPSAVTCLRVHTQKKVGRHPGPVSVKSSADVGTLHGGNCAWPRIAGFDGMVEIRNYVRDQETSATRSRRQSHSIVSSRPSTAV